MINSCVHIGIPEGMLELVKRFKIGEVVKIGCFMGFSRDNFSITLTAEFIEVITRVKVDVT